MNTVLLNKSKVPSLKVPEQAGEIWHYGGDVYILAALPHPEYALVNLRTGGTWNGIQKNAELCKRPKLVLMPKGTTVTLTVES